MLLVDPRQADELAVQALLRLRARQLAPVETSRVDLRTYIAQAWRVVEPATVFRPNWHIDAIADHLEAVTRGELRNLVINIPPRHMKSLTVCVFWPTWEWTFAPHRRYLFASYAESLSVRDALKSRRVIQSPWYQQRWGQLFRLTSDQNVKSRYENDRTGYRLATSVGGSATGEGGDRLVVDDPHKVDEAESELVREATITWWDETMSTRGNDPETVARVIVMQRLHEQDLTGHVLEQGGYHLLKLPAEYEPPTVVDLFAAEGCDLTHDRRERDGELLWPDRFDSATLNGLKKALGSYGTAGQLQQRPVPRAGAILDPELFRPLPADYTREGKTRIQFWDTAFSERQTADHTAAVTLDIDQDEHMYIPHVFRERLDGTVDPLQPDRPTRLDEAMAEHIAATRPDVVGVEEAAFKQQAVADTIRRVQKLLRGRHVVDIRAIPVDRDKITRARIVEGRSKAGDLYADRTAPWWTGYAAELAAFPKRKEDDQVDGTSGAVAMAIEHAALRATDREIGEMMKRSIPMRMPTGPARQPAPGAWMWGQR